MQSTSHPKLLQYALTAPTSAPRLRAWQFGRAVSLHETDRGFFDQKTDDMENIND